jgi:polysaccharide biosynthesis/export protein
LNYPKTIVRIIVLISVVFLTISCVRTRDFIYVRDYNLKDLRSDTTLVFKKNKKDTEYRLQKGDIIAINVYSTTPEQYNFLKGVTNNDSKDPLLDGHKIDEEGSIEFTAIGKVKIENLTLSESERLIKEKVSTFLENPSVSIKILNYYITILGEVKNPTKINNYNSRINILEAISMAGDVNSFANLKRVKIIRETADELKVSYLDLTKQELLYSDNYYLLPNDIIIVEPMKVKAIRSSQIPIYSLVLSTFSISFLILWRSGAIR